MIQYCIKKIFLLSVFIMATFSSTYNESRYKRNLKKNGYISRLDNKRLLSSQYMGFDSSTSANNTFNGINSGNVYNKDGSGNTYNGVNSGNTTTGNYSGNMVGSNNKTEMNMNHTTVINTGIKSDTKDSTDSFPQAESGEEEANSAGYDNEDAAADDNDKDEGCNGGCGCCCCCCGGCHPLKTNLE